MPATVEPPQDLYRSVAGAGNGSTLLFDNYWPAFSPTLLGICEMKSVGTPLSGLSTEIRETRFVFPVLGEKAFIESHDPFSAWDCGCDWTGLKTATPWLKPVLERMQYLRILPSQWDSHRAKPILDGAFSRVLTFLNSMMTPQTPPPSIVPLESGGLQAEWHRAGLDVEIEFEVPKGTQIYVYELFSQKDWESSDAVSLFAELGLSSRLAAGYDPADVG
ncbi:MAG TPA: hypothetical protein VNO20_04910 [Solirubrobacterales bacterium]|nr:hypothetical protein [Solirubrobacterales bacterium]